MSGSMMLDPEFDPPVGETGLYEPPEEGKSKKPATKEPVIDANHPFDIDVYISNYTGEAYGSSCPRMK